MPTERKGKGGKGEDAEDEAKDAPAIADVSAAVTAIAELTTAMRTEQKEAASVFGTPELRVCSATLSVYVSQPAQSVP